MRFWRTFGYCVFPDSRLEFWTGLSKFLAEFVGFEFLEVVDEHFGEFLSLLFPFFGISVSVAGIEDLGINAGEFGLYSPATLLTV